MLDKRKIQKRLRLLSVYSLVSSILIIVLLFLHVKTNFNDSKSRIGDSDSTFISHLTAERIDIIEPDGSLAIALSNSKTSAKLRFDGEIIHGASNRNTPNIIFFDGKGDEVGGMAFANYKEKDSPFTAIRHLAFDGYRQDEVITLSHFVQDGKSRKGVYIYDRPHVPIMEAFEETGIKPGDNPESLNRKLSQFREVNPVRHKELLGNPRRIALQTNEENEAQLILGDSEGNIRLRFLVKPDGEALIEFLDEKEKVIRRLEP